MKAIIELDEAQYATLLGLLLYVKMSGLLPPAETDALLVPIRDEARLPEGWTGREAAA